ncbi:MAG TPA: histidine kinase [Gaiellaceae bacterium]|jgi:two-component system sensor histidine kinase DesK
MRNPFETSRPGRGRVGVGLSLTFVALMMAGFLADSPGTLELGVGLGAVAAFVLTYVVVFLPPRPTSDAMSLAALAVLIALATALTFLDDAWHPLFVYIGAFMGRRLPRLAERGGLFALAGYTLAVGFAAGNPAFAVSMALTTFAIGFMLVGFSRLVASNDQLREAQGEIARLAAGEERLRIARDVHDLIGHDLSTIAVKAELAERLLEHDPERAAAELVDVQAVTRRALEEVRAAVHGYRESSLAAELAGAQAMLASAGIEVAVDREAGELPEEAESVLAWAVREGATNIARHSGARNAAFHVRVGSGDAELEIVDDGLGGNGAGGNGLTGLAERAAAASGRFEAGPRPGGGFRLRVAVPVGPA